MRCSRALPTKCTSGQHISGSDYDLLIHILVKMVPESHALEDLDSHRLENFIQMYTISRITNSLPQVNSIFGIDLTFTTSKNTISLLQ